MLVAAVAVVALLAVVVVLLACGGLSLQVARLASRLEELERPHLKEHLRQRVADVEADAPAVVH